MMEALRRLFAAVVLVGGLTTTMAIAAPCAASGTYDTYVALGATGCTVGNIHLSSFELVSTANPAGSAIPATSIIMSLDMSVPGEFTQNFATGMSATGPGSFKDILIRFVMLGLNGLMFYGDTLSFNGAAIGSGASTSVTANICTNGPLNICPLGSQYQAQVYNPPTLFNNSVFFGPTSTLAISKDALVSTVNDNSAANISSYTDTVHFFEGQVPEPGTFALFGIGLLLLGAFQKKG